MDNCNCKPSYAHNNIEMKTKSYRASLLILMLWIGTFSCQAQSPRVPYVFNDVSVQEFESTSGRLLDVYISLPVGYDSQREEGYPVLYVMDGFFHFQFTQWLQTLLQVEDGFPPVIVVGIDNQVSSYAGWVKGRRFLLTPSKDLEYEAAEGEKLGMQITTGGGPIILDIIADEIAPWIEDNHNTSHERWLSGHSLGGLFVAYALFTRSDAFSVFLIGSPSLWWDNEFIFSLESQYATTNDDLKATVFLSAGERDTMEILPQMIELAGKLEARNYPSLKLKSMVFENESHSTAVPPFFSQGMRFIFEGY
ncbi:MAG: alpha/beta hydrolase-fold protein [Ignavibacteriaceae bacterium]